MIKPLPEQIEKTAQRLLQLKARHRLFEQAEKARIRKAEKRDQAKTIAALLRSEDAHRKIQLGGVVIAAGAEGLDPAELCGWLLSIMETPADVRAARGSLMRQKGLRRFEERKPTKA